MVWIEPPGEEATLWMYRSLGILRADIRTTSGPDNIGKADYVVFQNKSTEFTDISRGLLATREPCGTIDEHGVPLLYVFCLTDGGEAQ